MGMLHARDSEYFMVDEDDDLVSRSSVSFVSQHSGENGWYLDEGYIWTGGSRLLCCARSFGLSAAALISYDRTFIIYLQRLTTRTT